MIKKHYICTHPLEFELKNRNIDECNNKVDIFHLSHSFLLRDDDRSTIKSLACDITTSWIVDIRGSSSTL